MLCLKLACASELASPLESSDFQSLHHSEVKEVAGICWRQSHVFGLAGFGCALTTFNSDLQLLPIGWRRYATSGALPLWDPSWYTGVFFCLIYVIWWSIASDSECPISNVLCTVLTFHYMCSTVTLTTSLEKAGASGFERLPRSLHKPYKQCRMQAFAWSWQLWVGSVPRTESPCYVESAHGEKHADKWEMFLYMCTGQLCLLGSLGQPL